MCFGLDRRHDLHEPLHIVARDAARDSLLEIGEVAVHAPGGLTALCGRRDHERTAIGRADFPGDESAIGEPIEDARQRRSFVREAAVQVGDGRRPRGRKQGEDVRLALREAVFTQTGEIEPDPVGRPVNRWNEAQRHRRSSTREPGSCPAAAGTRGGSRRLRPPA